MLLCSTQLIVCRMLLMYLCWTNMLFNLTFDTDLPYCNEFKVHFQLFFDGFQFESKMHLKYICIRLFYIKCSCTYVWTASHASDFQLREKKKILLRYYFQVKLAIGFAHKKMLLPVLVAYYDTHTAKHDSISRCIKFLWP